MRIAFLALTLVFLCGISGSVSAQTNAEVIRAFEAGIAKQKQFDTIFNFIVPDKFEEKWRQVPWIPGLWEGIEVAKKANKPMFIWAMNGDPLGCV